jgi:hypothetical protein
MHPSRVVVYGRETEACERVESIGETLSPARRVRVDETHEQRFGYRVEPEVSGQLKRVRGQRRGGACGVN